MRNLRFASLLMSHSLFGSSPVSMKRPHTELDGVGQQALDDVVALAGDQSEQEEDEEESAKQCNA